MPLHSDKEQQALALEVRRNIYTLVKKYAGCHFRELERKSKLATGTIQHHLTYLVRHGLVKEEKTGQHSRYFPIHLSSSDKKLLSFLRQKATRTILVLLLEQKNITHQELAKALCLSPSTVSWHVHKLVRANIISTHKEGRHTTYTLIAEQEKIKKLLISYQESFFDTLVDNVVELWDI